MRSDLDRVRAIPLFSDMSDEDLQKLASWLTVEDVSEGRRLTPEGGPGYQFYVIEEGTAEVRRNKELIGSLGPGDFFGEMAIIRDGRRIADVVATSPMRLLAMFGTSFRELEAGLPLVAGRISETLQERLPR